MRHPRYLRKARLEALLLGQGRRSQAGVLGVEQVTGVHVERWDLSCSASQQQHN